MLFRTNIKHTQIQKAQKVLETQLLEGLVSGQATEMTVKDWQAVCREVKNRVTKKPKKK